MMKLCITVNNEIELLGLDTMSIYGKEIVEYWLEYSRYKGYSELHIYGSNNNNNSTNIQYYENMYGVKLIYTNQSEKSISKDDSDEYKGVGIFLDNGEYQVLKTLNDILSLEKILSHNPLGYSSSIGYGKSEQIHIGKNVYIHDSVKLLGAVVIGDNCSINQGVTIQDSIVDKGCYIEEGTSMINSHISTNIHMFKNLYLKDKVLFKLSIYDIATKTRLIHEGICKKSNFRKKYDISYCRWNRLWKNHSVVCLEEEL